MLSKISLENYRCYSTHEIDFRNLSIVVGKNNAGKSTLVESLRLVSLALSRFRSINYSSHPNWVDLPLIARGISPSLKSIGFNTENLFHNYGEPPSKITASFSNQSTVTIYIGGKGEIFCTLCNSKGEFIQNKGAAIQLDIPQVNILPQITSIQKEEVILNKEYVRQNLSTDLASLHFRNQLALLYESFPKFSEMAQSSWKGLRVFDLDGRMGMPGDHLSLLVQDGAFVSEIGWMGHGLQMWLQIMWFLARANESEVIILDEPDVYMHPDLQRKLIRLLRNRFKQVIVSTHSIEIISEVDPENILIIDKEKNKSIFASKVPVVQRILNSIGSIHNLQLTKLWASKKLLIVEGEDVLILKRLQKTIFPNSEDPFDSIPNFDINGWGGWNYARGSSMLLKDTVDDTVNIYCLFDSDFFTSDTKKERIDEAKKIGVEIHIWSRKEIENYLVVPTAILRILKVESKKPVTITVADLERLILEKAKELEENVIHNFANELQKADRKLSINTAISRAKLLIDDLLFRVTGKDLISALSKWAQENYKVSLSTTKLANCLEKSEIDIEIVQVIQAIEKNRPFKKV